jgi:hypothetical protein
MDLQVLQDVANDVVIARLELDSLIEQREAFIKANPQIVELDAKIEQATLTKRELTNKMLEIMREAQVKSWKTEKANFARAVKKTVEFDPIVKKQIENRIKNGEQVENWTLKETEYISIRSI